MMRRVVSEVRLVPEKFFNIGRPHGMEWYGWNGMESKEVKVDENVHREKEMTILEIFKSTNCMHLNVI